MDYGGLTVGHVATGKDTLAGGHAVRQVTGDEEFALVVLQPRRGAHYLGVGHGTDGHDDIIGGQRLANRFLARFCCFEHNLLNIQMLVYV